MVVEVEGCDAGEAADKSVDTQGGGGSDGVEGGGGSELEVLSTQIAPNGNSGGKKKKAKNRGKKAAGAEGGGEIFWGEAVGCVGGDEEGRKEGSD